MYGEGLRVRGGSAWEEGRVVGDATFAIYGCWGGVLE